MDGLLDTYLASQCLGLAVLSLAVHALLPGGLAGLGGTTTLGDEGGLLQDLRQAFHGRLNILFPVAEFLGLDYQYTFLGQALVGHSQEFFLDMMWYGRTMNIKAQMDSRGNLVDVLATGTLGANGLYVDGMRAIAQPILYLCHDSYSQKH